MNMTPTIKIIVSQSHMSCAGVTDSRLWLATSADNRFFRFCVQSPHFSRPVSRFSRQYKLVIFAALPPSFRKHRDDYRLAVAFTIASRDGSRQAAVPACHDMNSQGYTHKRQSHTNVTHHCLNMQRPSQMNNDRIATFARNSKTCHRYKRALPPNCPHFQFTFCSSNTPPRGEHRRLTKSLPSSLQGMSGAISN